jgi:hypothetical protein
MESQQGTMEESKSMIFRLNGRLMVRVIVFPLVLTYWVGEYIIYKCLEDDG